MRGDYWLDSSCESERVLISARTVTLHGCESQQRSTEERQSDSCFHYKYVFKHIGLTFNWWRLNVNRLFRRLKSDSEWTNQSTERRSSGLKDFHFYANRARHMHRRVFLMVLEDCLRGKNWMSPRFFLGDPSNDLWALRWNGHHIRTKTSCVPGYYIQCNRWTYILCIRVLLRLFLHMSRASLKRRRRDRGSWGPWGSTQIG